MQLEIPLLSDLHLHLRQGDMLREVAPYTDRCCGYALVMPNTDPPLTNVDRLKEYAASVNQVLKHCKPLLTFKLTKEVNREQIQHMKAAGAVAGKLYPEGVTTNSGDGWSRADLTSPDLHPLMRAALDEIQKRELVLCIHAELPGSFSLDREGDMLGFVGKVLNEFPELRIVIEHVTTAEGVDYVHKRALPRLAATITAHHLVLTLDDVIGDKLAPHNFCKPVAKRPQDKESLIQAAIGRYGPQFFLGSDSAPHRVEHKHCDAGCAGCFTAPVLPELLAQVFEAHGALDHLPQFCTRLGNAFYRLPEREGKLRLTKESWTVGADGPVRPFMAGQVLTWKAERIG